MSALKLYKYRVRCTTTDTYQYIWLDENASAPTTCPVNTNHTIDSNLTRIEDTRDPTLENYTSDMFTQQATYDYDSAVLPQRTIYNEQIASSYSPIVQNSPISRSIHAALFVVFSYGGGTVTVNKNAGSFEIATGSGVGDYALLRSKRVVKYRPGYSNVVRFAVKFSTPVANSLQMCGVGNAMSDLYIGYSGTEFGVRYSTDGRIEAQELVITTASNNSGTATITLNGVEFTANITNAGGDTAFTAWEISTATFAGWNAHSEDSTVHFMATAAGVRNGTYSVSFSNATAGSLSQMVDGKALTTTFVSLANMNGVQSIRDSLNPLKYSMYSINYAWYGASAFQFSVLDPDTEAFRVLHTFRFSNVSDDLSLTFPNMYLQRFTASLGSTTPLTMYTAGSFAATVGSTNVSLLEPQVSVIVEKSISQNSETVLVAIKHRDDVFGYPIQSEIYAGLLTASTVSTKPLIVRILRNPSSIGSNVSSNFPNWSPVGTDSTLLYTTTPSTTSGGDVVMVIIIGANGSQVINLINNGVVIGRQDTLIITGECSSASDVYISLQMFEDV